MLVLHRKQLVHIDTLALAADEACWNETLCNDSEDSHRWLVGGKEAEGSRGFIKSIRIVYK